MSEKQLLVPPEWAPQSAIWVGWPHARGEWGVAFDGARLEIAEFVCALSRVTPVRIACGSREAYGSAWFALEPEIATGQVKLHTLPSGDIWLRDTGPVFAIAGHELTALKFRFNGWGGKYVMPGDTMTADGIASVERTQRVALDFVLEGGAIDLDGAGQLLTTRQCLLNPNRNSSWQQSDAETALRHAFSVDRIIWLEDGLLNDHTDGHVDNIARFIGPNRVLCQTPSGSDDPNTELLLAIRRDLQRAGLDVAELPSPGRVLDDAGHVVPASHMNFVISNQHVFLPTYESVHAPKAVKALAAALPDYTIVDLPARSILAGGGAFHCMTQQVPACTEAN